MNTVGYGVERRETRSYAKALLKRQKLSGPGVDRDGTEDETCIDRLSNLPKEILDLILVKLGPRDAVKTSLFCQDWRHQWKYLSQLSFNDPSYPYKNITRMLQNHKGQIDKLHFATLRLGCEHMLDQWIDIASERGVKDLMVKNGGFYEILMLPPRIFAVSRLVHLHIFGWNVKLPSSFKGLRCLRTLHLKCVRISNDDFYTLVSSCGNLERLILRGLFRTGVGDNNTLKISGNNLKELVLTFNTDEQVVFENCPHITSIAIKAKPCKGVPRIFRDSPLYDSSKNPTKLKRQTACIMFKSLEAFFLQRLYLCGDMLKNTDMTIMERMLPVLCSRLKTLHLRSIPLDHQNSIETLLMMLSHSPDLELLDLKVSCDQTRSSTRNLAKELQNREILPLGKLRFLNVRYGSAYEVESWLHVLMLIVSSTPVLEQCTFRRLAERFKYIPEKTIEKMIKKLKRACTSCQTTFNYEYKPSPEFSSTL